MMNSLKQYFETFQIMSFHMQWILVKWNDWQLDAI